MSPPDSEFTPVWGKALLAGFVLAGLVAGCALDPTPYQPAQDGFGYTDQAITDRRYRVTFAGNTATPRTTVDNYLMLRAAELTLERGHDYFVVVDKDIERSTRFDSTVTGNGFHAGFHSFHRPHSIGFTTATTRPRDRYSAYADIVLRRGEAPANSVDAYPAAEVIEHLGDAVGDPPS